MNIYMPILLIFLIVFVSCNQKNDEERMRCEASTCVIQKKTLEELDDFSNYRINESTLPKGIKILYKNENRDDVDCIMIFNNPFVTTICFDSLGKVESMDSNIPEVTSSTVRDISGYQIHLKFDSLGEAKKNYNPIMPPENASIKSIIEGIKAVEKGFGAP
ncbi:hypothetical protein B7988_08495 [Fibrobacter sp. UWB1]|uniref:hypothetical protein n=1 Tax=Fibrobacter sp. UWB1 TaxID=1964355 RepID=UPI000B64CA7E|nr:hypothetical protein [Fibrobacter sp. UWB1]OWV25835.1 hypothetical protein B7988_08495 [Fibrobacter sp. UWB1]